MLYIGVSELNQTNKKPKFASNAIHTYLSMKKKKNADNTKSQINLRSEHSAVIFSVSRM